MANPKYVKPQVQALNRTLAVSIGGCNAGITPGTCGLPGNTAGTCDPNGATVGVPAGDACVLPGNYAVGGCNPGFNAFAVGCSTGTHANGPIPVP